MHINTEYIRTVLANTRTFVWYTSIATMHNNFFLCVSRYICICGTSTFEQLYLKVKIDGTDTKRTNVMDCAIYFSISVSRWWFQIFLLFSPRTLADGLKPPTRYTPWKINIEPTNHTWKERKMIFQTSMIMFHVNLQGFNISSQFAHDFFSLTNPWIESGRPSTGRQPSSQLQPAGQTSETLVDQVGFGPDCCFSSGMEIHQCQSLFTIMIYYSIISISIICIYICIYIHIQYVFRRIDCRYDSFLLLSYEFSLDIWGALGSLSGCTSWARKWRWQKDSQESKITKPNHQFIRWFSSWHHGMFAGCESRHSPPLKLAFPSFQWPGSVRCQAAWGAKPRGRCQWDSRASNSSGGPERSETWLKNGPRFSRIPAPGIEKTLEFMRLLMNSILFIRLLVFVGMHTFWWVILVSGNVKNLTPQQR